MLSDREDMKQSEGGDRTLFCDAAVCYLNHVLVFAIGTLPAPVLMAATDQVGSDEISE
jgi:hypothetical protein